MASRVWSFVPSPLIYAPYVGSARRQSDGGTVVHFGTSPGIGGATGPISTFEVGPDGQIRWHLVIENIGGVDLSYRNEPLESIAGEHSAP